MDSSTVSIETHTANRRRDRIVALSYANMSFENFSDLTSSFFFFFFIQHVMWENRYAEIGNRRRAEIVVFRLSNRLSDVMVWIFRLSANAEVYSSSSFFWGGAQAPLETPCCSYL